MTLPLINLWPNPVVVFRYERVALFSSDGGVSERPLPLAPRAVSPVRGPARRRPTGRLPITERGPPTSPRPDTDCCTCVPVRPHALVRSSRQRVVAITVTAPRRFRPVGDSVRAGRSGGSVRRASPRAAAPSVQVTRPRSERCNWSVRPHTPSCGRYRNGVQQSVSEGGRKLIFPVDGYPPYAST